MNYVVVYDVVDNKKRKQIADILNEYGVRVNYSVFEIKIKKTELKKVVLKLLDILEKKEDSLRFYHICKNCEMKSFEMCDNIDIFGDKEFFV